MKKILYMVMTVVCCFTLTSCDDDEWGNGDPAMEHVYYVGFEDWGNFKNNVVFNINKGEALDIPVQFHSERVRSYDVETYFYVGGTLQRGVDYEVIDNNGAVISPNADGAFTIKWPQAKKGIQMVSVRALNAGTGSFNVFTFDPNAGEIAHPDNITNSKTNNYEVRSFTQNYKVTVNIK